MPKVEQGHKDLETRLDGIEQSIRDQISQFQSTIIDQITALLTRNNNKEKAFSSDPNIQDQEGIESHTNVQLDILNPEKRMYINFAGASANHPMGATARHPIGASASQPIDLGASYENEVPDLNTLNEIEKVRANIEKAYDERFRFLEEKFNAIQEVGQHGNDASDLSLVVDLVLPPKFKAPDFDKYDGTTSSTTSR